MEKLNFSGHESFHCRELWLKKGFDFVKAGNTFQTPSAVVELGVGKNMVGAIHYWMTAFHLLDAKKRLTPFANYLFGDYGKDPYLEDDATLWLLHYNLVKTSHASIYPLFFNEFRKERPEFTKNHLADFLERKCKEKRILVSENTINKDVGVFFNTYLRPLKNQKNLEDLLTGILINLELLERIDKVKTDGSFSWYRSFNKEQREIPEEILLYCILDNENYGDSISLHTLLTGEQSVGSIFALSPNGLVQKIKKLTEKYKDIIYTDDAGIREIQFKDKPEKWDVLDNYYNGK